jgi:putative transposase
MGGMRVIPSSFSLACLIESVYHSSMKLTVQIQLLPAVDQSAKLLATVERFNEAAGWIAGELFARQMTNKIEAQRFLYAEIRERFGLSSQMAILCLHRACEAYRRDKAIRPKFRKHAAITYDVRTMSFKGIDKVSLLTLDGRVVVPFILGAYQAARIGYPKGQADLARRKDGKWFLVVTVDLPEETRTPATDFIGVDLGIAAIATDSDGNHHSGAAVEAVRKRHNFQRKRLQRRGTTGARKKLKRVAGKEARFKRHENHCIAKAIVESARRTGRGIALEDLKDIRLRVTARGGEARNRLGGWGFAQLGMFIEYKSRLAGIDVVYVAPRNTSRTCNRCSHCQKSNRKSQSEFTCKACGYTANADQNAARNIRALGISKLPTGLASPQA